MAPKRGDKPKSAGPKVTTNSDAPVARAGHQIVCLFTVRQILSDLEKNVNDTLYTFVHVIIEGFQHQSIACSRVVVGSLCVQTENFLETPWMLSSDIVTSEGKAGRLDVSYLKKMKPKHDEEPFLLEERILMDTLAAELSAFIERTRAKRLRVQQQRELELYSSLLRHDLKNDMSVILSNVDLLRMITDRSDSGVREALSSIEAVSERMMGLLQALGKPSDSLGRGIALLVRGACRQAEEANTGMKLNVIVDPEAEDLKIEESRLLPAVFDNLLRNAAKYAGATPIVEVHVSLVGSYAQVVVSDNGPGIAESLRDKLFQKGASTTGGGLGLYLSREIVNGMGGSIELVDTEKGSGATFKVMLPKAI